ncbi:hypothetical protein T07_6196 [Trichinella nelsoni]|uniref:Uncharacterized protein n=1 Tax=Trichinella nelsoni TaxID=6336 RepID=A0A0V0RU61_9BILA|nr:hypothetical protein T07_6196 [Trichinella nelsoni]
MDSIQITETPALRTKCWRENLIRFLICGMTTNSVMTTRCRLFHVHEQQGVSQTLSNNRTVHPMPVTDKTRLAHANS